MALHVFTLSSRTILRRQRHQNEGTSTSRGTEPTRTRMATFGSREEMTMWLIPQGQAVYSVLLPLKLSVCVGGGGHLEEFVFLFQLPDWARWSGKCPCWAPCCSGGCGGQQSGPHQRGGNSPAKNIASWFFTCSHPAEWAGRPTFPPISLHMGTTKSEMPHIPFG